MSTQARIPPGLAAVHNFILDHDETDIDHYLDDPDFLEAISTGELGEGSIPRDESERAIVWRDEIATEMWNSYLQFIQDHPDVLEQDFIPENE